MLIVKGFMIGKYGLNATLMMINNHYCISNKNQFRSLFNIVNKVGKDKTYCKLFRDTDQDLRNVTNLHFMKILFKNLNGKSTMTNYYYFLTMIIFGIAIHLSVPRYLLVELVTKERGKDFKYITLIDSF